ncbi:hypothetical protein FBU30_002848, partial [Linnemannia zychae]
AVAVVVAAVIAVVVTVVVVVVAIDAAVAAGQVVAEAMYVGAIVECFEDEVTLVLDHQQGFAAVAVEIEAVETFFEQGVAVAAAEE